MYLQRTQNRKIKKKNSIFAAAFILLLPLTVFAQSEHEKQLFGFVNSERAREKLPPLFWDDELYAVAFAHSADMANSGRASHRGSDRKEPHDRIREANIFAAKAGENIARDVNVVSAHTLLMQSVDHRANILEPEYTHAAVAVVRQKQYLYITELFIHKVPEYPVRSARETLMNEFNMHRMDRKMSPLVYSESLSHAAQAHVETQVKFNSLTPMLTMSPIARSNKAPTLVSIYTATTLREIPLQVRKDLQGGFRRVGIGYKRVQGAICTGGCYLIVLVFG